MSAPLDRRPVRPFSRTELVQILGSVAGGLGTSVTSVEDRGALAEALAYVALVVAKAGGETDAATLACLGLSKLKATDPAAAPAPDEPYRRDMTDRECVTVLGTLILALVRMAGPETVRQAFRWIAEDDPTWEGMAKYLEQAESEAARTMFAATRGGSA